MGDTPAVQAGLSDQVCGLRNWWDLSTDSAAGDAISSVCAAVSSRLSDLPKHDRFRFRVNKDREDRVVNQDFRVNNLFSSKWPQDSLPFAKPEEPVTPLVVGT